MRWPFLSRRRHEAELAAVKADRERLRGERDQFAQDRDAHRAAARTAAEKFVDADTAVIRLAGRVDALTRQLRIADSAAGIDHERAQGVGARLRTVRDAAARGREQVASGGEAS